MVQHSPATQLWTPYRVRDMQKIESLFRSFFSKIYPISDLNYWDRLSALNVYSQERRMERHQIMYTWKILERIAPNGSPVPTPPNKTLYIW